MRQARALPAIHKCSRAAAPSSLAQTARLFPLRAQTTLAYCVFLEEGKAFYLQLCIRLQQRYGAAGFATGGRLRLPARPCLLLLAGVRRMPGVLLQQTTASSLVSPCCAPALSSAALAEQHLQAMGLAAPLAVAPAPAPADCRAAVHRCLICIGDLCRCGAGSTTAARGAGGGEGVGGTGAAVGMPRHGSVWQVGEQASRKGCAAAAADPDWPPAQPRPPPASSRAGTRAARSRRRRRGAGRSAATSTRWLRASIPRASGY